MHFRAQDPARHVQVLSRMGRMTAESRRRRVMSLLWLGVGFIWVLGGIRMFWFHITYDPFTDIHVYYDAAARLNAGLPLYPPGARIYPPLFSILFRPLALLPFELAAAIWEGILLAAFGLTLWRLGIRRPVTWWAVVVLSIGIAWTLAIGQVEAIVTVLVTLGNPLTIALAANIKLYPLLVGIYWLARGEWRSLGRLVGWTAGLILLQLILDPSDTLAFPGTLNPSEVASEVASVGNLSPFALSPFLWAALLVVGFIVTLRLGRTRWGWASAVALSVLAPPRVFSYNLMTLLACLGGPDRVSLDPRTQCDSSRLPAAQGSPMRRDRGNQLGDQGRTAGAGPAPS
jgi:hypothetical protein